MVESLPSVNGPWVPSLALQEQTNLMALDRQGDLQL
jgi:hypothetical protein